MHKCIIIIILNAVFYFIFKAKQSACNDRRKISAFIVVFKNGQYNTQIPDVKFYIIDYNFNIRYFLFFFIYCCLFYCFAVIIIYKNHVLAFYSFVLFTYICCYTFFRLINLIIFHIILYAIFLKNLTTMPWIGYFWPGLR